MIQIYSFFFWSYIILYFFFVPLFAIPCSLLLGVRRSFQFFMKFFSRIGFFILGIHIDVIGLENIPKGAHVSLICNHPSFLDPFIILAALPDFYNFIIFSGVLKNPYALVALRGAGGVYKPSGGDFGGSVALLNVIKRMNAGESFMLFPSEYVATDGTITIKPSLYKILEETNTLFAPVHISNTNQLRARFRVSPFRVKVVIGKLMTNTRILSSSDQGKFIKDSIGNLANK